MGRAVTKIIIVASLVVLCILVFPVSAAAQLAPTEENRWATKSQAIARRELMVTASNGKIYAIGGMDFLACLNYNQEYDPASDKWTIKESMPTARADAAIAVYGNKIYVIGGTTCAGAQERYGHGIDYSKINVTGINEVYDPATDTWENKTPMPTPRMCVSASVVNGKIYLIGGFEKAGTSTGTVQIYDVETDSWSTKTSMPTGVGGHASAVINNSVYLFGGSKKWMSGYANTLALTQVYDTEGDAWTYATSIPDAPAFPVAGSTMGLAAPELVYIISYPNITQVYNPHNDTWGVAAQMSTNRCTFGVAVVDDLLYVIGGGSAVFPTIYFSGYNEQYTPLGYGAINQPSTSPHTNTSSIPNPSPYESPNLSASPSPSTQQQLPVSSPEPRPTAFPAEPIYATSVAIAIMITAIVAVVLRKRKKVVKRSFAIE
jgi:hypothetical protein